MSYLRVEFHVLHPSPSPESGKGFPTAGFLLRRNRTIRSLPVRDFCSGAYTSASFKATVKARVDNSHCRCRRGDSAVDRISSLADPENDCLTCRICIAVGLTSVGI